MRARYPAPEISLIAAQVELSPGIGRVRALCDSFANATPETVAAILVESSKFAEAYLAPLNDTADAEGCRLVDGRVVTAPGHREAWQAYSEAGWGTLDQPQAHGGQGLPLAVAAAVQEVFDRACPAFGMLPVPIRSASRLILAHADVAIQNEWLPKLTSGEWAATICISEADAGSDAGRIRTRAERCDDGSWAITGEKCWISYGDHDLTRRIGHCLLARVPGAPPGGAGLSLFLVPDVLDDTSRNAITVRRVEHKLGLHGSPTCGLGFEGATGYLIGSEGRGLAQMFAMITNMRLSVGVQGLGIASGCADLALAYAADRRQGGSNGTSMAIIEHADVQRLLLGMAAQVEVLRGLALALANQADIAACDPDDAVRGDAAALVQWLLPIVKTAGGEIASEVSNAAIQVLGGAGYVREWPVEQAMRDARVLTIFEGTTGIQALDLLHRRLLRGERRGFDIFCRLARAAQAGSSEPEAAQFGQCLDHLEAAAARMIARNEPAQVNAGATAFLHLAALAAMGWIAARLASVPHRDAASARLVTAGRYWLHDIGDRATLLRAQAEASTESLAGIGRLRVG